MSEFLIELYVARTDQAAVDAGAERARRAAEQLTREGTQVAYVRALFAPEEETCFYLYQAESADAVREAARRAALRFENVIHTVPESTEEICQA